MIEFLNSMSQPLQKPNYRREFFYDFKKYKSKRTSCPFQCFFLVLRQLKDHWNNKLRFCTMLILPAIFIYLSWHCARYYSGSDVPSRVMEPDWMPM